jgi:hypothetical protein
MDLRVDYRALQQQRELTSNLLGVRVAGLLAQSPHQRFKIPTEPNTRRFDAPVLAFELDLRIYRETAREVASFKGLSPQFEYRQ